MTCRVLKNKPIVSLPPTRRLRFKQHLFVCLFLKQNCAKTAQPVSTKCSSKLAHGPVIHCLVLVVIWITLCWGSGRVRATVRCAPCGLRGCKNRPAPFPGRMSYKATKPGLVSVLYLSVFYCVVVY